MKKLFLTLIIAALMLSCFCGCGGNRAESPAESELAVDSTVLNTEPTGEPLSEAAPAIPSGETVAVEESQAVETVDVSFPLVKDGEEATLSICWDCPNILTNFGINSAMDEVFWYEMRERSGVDLEFVLSANNDGFLLMLAGGDYPDIFWNCNSYITTLGGDDWALENGVLLDFGPYLEQYAPDYAAVLDEHSEYANVFRSSSGAYLYFCMFYENNSRDMGMVVRSDWLEEQNLEVPITVSELEIVLTTFKSKYEIEYPIGMYVDTMSNGGIVDNGICTAFGNTYGTTWCVDPYAKNGTDITFAPLEAQWKDYITLLHSWYEDGLINSDFYSFNNIKDKSPAVISENMGVFNDEVTNLETFSKLIRENSGDTDAQLLGIPYPVARDGETNHLANNVLVCRKLGFSISAQCEEPELAVMFLNYLYTDEGKLLTNYGVEGTSFEYDADGNPILMDVVTANPNIPFALALNKYCMQQGSMICDMNRTRSKFTENDYQTLDNWA